VAIKSYDMTGNEDSLRRQAIMNEINILRDIDHRNLSKLYGVY
jgi:serine/threonine protein kinase